MNERNTATLPGRDNEMRMFTDAEISGELAKLIPRTAFIPCPKQAFANVRVLERCPGCEHFRGLVQVAVGERLSFVHAFRVACAHPVTRAMIHVEA